MEEYKCYGTTGPPPEEVKGTLSRSRQFGYGVGHVLNDLCAACWFSYLLVYLSKVALLSDTQTGLLMLIGQVADGLATPIVGFLSDRTTSHHGRRTLWVCIGSLAVAGTFPMIYHLPVFNSIDRTVYYAFFIILFQLAWASVQVSHLALAPELSYDKQERAWLTTLRSCFTILANLEVFIVAYFLFRNDSSQAVTPEDEGAFHRLAICVIGTGLAFTALFWLLVKEEPSYQIILHKGGLWHEWLKRTNFYLVGCVYMCTRAYVNITQTYLSLYLLNSLEAPKTSIAVVPASVFLVSFGATLCSSHLSKYLDSAQTTLVGIGFGLLGCVCFFFTPAGPEWFVALFGSIAFGLGSGLVGVAALQMISDLLGRATCSSAFVYGVMSFADKVLNGTVMMCVQAWTPASTSPSFQNYHRYAVSFLPALACIIGGVLIGVLKLLGFPRGTQQETTPMLISYGPRRRSTPELRAIDTGVGFIPPETPK